MTDAGLLAGPTIAIPAKAFDKRFGDQAIAVAFRHRAPHHAAPQ